MLYKRKFGRSYRRRRANKWKRIKRAKFNKRVRRICSNTAERKQIVGFVGLGAWSTGPVFSQLNAGLGTGVDEFSRIGVKTVFRSIYVKGSWVLEYPLCNAATMNNVPEYCRLMIIIWYGSDNANCNWPTDRNSILYYTDTSIYPYNMMYSPLSTHQGKRMKVLYDKTVCLDATKSRFNMKYYRKIYLPVTYDTTNTPDKRIYFLQIYPPSTNYPVIRQWDFRCQYTDS